MFIKGVKGYQKYIAKYLGLEKSELVSITSDFNFKFDDFHQDAKIATINNIIEEEFNVPNFIQLWDFISAENYDWSNVIDDGLKEENDEDKLEIYTFLKDEYYSKFENYLNEFFIYELDNEFWSSDIFILDICNEIEKEVNGNSEIKNLTYILNTYQFLVESIIEANNVIKNDELIYLKSFFERLLFFYKSIYDHFYDDYAGYIIKLELSYSKKYGLKHSLKNNFNFDKVSTRLYDYEVGFKLSKPISNYGEVLNLLIDKGFFKKGTLLTIFKNAFSSINNNKIETPIVWERNIDELNYFIRRLDQKQIIDSTGKNYQKHWKYAKTVFRHKDSNTMMDNLSGNNKTPLKKEEIDYIVDYIKTV